MHFIGVDLHKKSITVCVMGWARSTEADGEGDVRKPATQNLHRLA
jgi:hypothetical protein